jgi:hypothetical protein
MKKKEEQMKKKKKERWKSKRKEEEEGKNKAGQNPVNIKFHVVFLFGKHRSNER